jgi:SAM-dependent methyltransferase
LNNYEYCARFAAGRAGGPEYRVLDYGCGQGRIVTRMRERGLDAYGCDVFYGGADHLESVPAELVGTTIRIIEDGRVPFPDGHFDLVVSNMVFEHVADIDLALGEIRRVLKPDGEFLCLFPDRSVWREGHCGVPFLHRFPRNGLREGYALAWRLAGFGSHTEGKGRREWVRHKCDWIDRWTHYRTYPEIHRAFARHFTDLRHLEADRLDKRLGPGHPVTRLAPAWLKRVLTRRLACLVLLATRREAAAAEEA